MHLVRACFLLGALTFAPAALAQPVEAFGRLPSVADVAISPDGRRVALATSEVDAPGSVLIIDLEQPGQRSGYRVGDRMQLRDVRWVDNERVAYLVNQTFMPGQVLPEGWRFRGAPRRVDYFRWGAINTTTRHAITLTTNPENPWADQGARMIAPIGGDDGYVRMVGETANLDRNHSSLFRVELDSGRVRTITPGGVNEDTYDYVVDRSGAVVARLDTNRSSNRWRLFVYDGERERLLLEDVSDYGSPISIQGLLPDGRLVALERNDAGHDALYAINKADGRMEILYQADNADIDGALIDHWTREVVGATWTGEETEDHYFDQSLQEAHSAMMAALPGRAARIETWSQDRMRFIVYAENGLDGGGYFLFDRQQGVMRFLTARYPDLFQTNAGQRQSITYRARDGTRIPAYLTIPAGRDARNLPLIVLVHGGPHRVRDTMAFDYEAAFYASRGYAVLQPNFRGSGGYGQAWEDAGRRQWGGLMQTDVEDGADALVRGGIADASRICIVGASYGGYAALAGATLTPERYRCAVSVAGVSDLSMMLTQIRNQTGGSDSSLSEWWSDSIGDREEDRERIRSVSPALLADRVQIPILLIHGTNDTVVPIEQSRRMQRALQSAGKDVRFVELRGDDHWLSDAPTRIQMLREIEAFLGQHIGAAAN